MAASTLAFYSNDVDRDGKPRGPKHYVMSKRGKIWSAALLMAGLSAVRFNPPVRTLHLRVIAEHPDKKALAIGHAMRNMHNRERGRERNQRDQAKRPWHNHQCRYVFEAATVSRLTNNAM